MSQWIKIAGLYEKTRPDGTKFLIGRLGGARVLISENTRPIDGDNSTHSILLASADPPADGNNGRGNGTGSYPNSAPSTARAARPTERDDPNEAPNFPDQWNNGHKLK